MSAQNSLPGDFYSCGIQYMNTTERSIMRRDKFNPVTIYNMSAIAIEKLIMGACITEGKLPFCQSLTSIAEYSKNVIGLDEKLVEDIKLMDSMQILYSEDDLTFRKPVKEDIIFFVDVMKRIFKKTEIFINCSDSKSVNTWTTL